MLVDSHCHLHFIDLNKLNISFAQLLSQATENKVEHILCVATDTSEYSAIMKLIADYSWITASIGVHPTEVTTPITFMELIDLAKNPKIVAIGETGLDFYRDKTQKNKQIDSFCTHIAVAKKINKPLIIHTRAAKQATIDCLKQEQAKLIGGVMHCFTEDWQMAKQALDLGFYISISGIVTFKNAAELREVAKKIPLDRLLIETDAPYLSPVPNRGQINQPAYVKHTAEFLAELRNISFEKLAKHTTSNYYRLFA